MKKILFLFLMPALAMAQTNLINFVSRPATTNEATEGTNITRWITPNTLRIATNDLSGSLTTNLTTYRTHISFTNGFTTTTIFTAPGTTGQGTLVTNYTYVPYLSNGTIQVRARVSLTTPSTVMACAGLFVGTSTNIVDVTYVQAGSGQMIAPVSLIYTFTNTGTNTVPISVRFGPYSSGTAYLNLNTSGGILFTNSRSHLEIIETK